MNEERCISYEGNAYLLCRIPNSLGINQNQIKYPPRLHLVLKSFETANDRLMLDSENNA